MRVWVGGRNIIFYEFLFLFCYILYLHFGLFLAGNTSMQEDVADTFPCYFGSMLVYFKDAF